MGLVVLRRHQEGERDFEGVVDLCTVEPKLKARTHARKRRHDAKAEGGEIEVEIADRLDEVARERDLLVGLAQRRGERACVGRLDLAAGKDRKSVGEGK